jgi:hypothetical protein
MEQRHGDIAVVGRAEVEASGHHRACDRDLALAADDRLGVSAGARGVDQHEDVRRLGRSCRHSDVALRGHLVGPLGGVDVDAVDLADGGQHGRISKYQLTIGVRDVASQRFPAPDRVQPHRDDARQACRYEQCREERGVL